MKIQDILNQSKPCWKYAAMTDHGWVLYSNKPKYKYNRWIISHGTAFATDYVFDIEPFDGDWKDSLIIRSEE